MKQAKKILLSAGVVLVFVAYSGQQRHKDTVVALAPTSNDSGQASSNNSSGEIDLNTDQTQKTDNSASSQSNSSSLGASTTASKYKDGQYTGNEADAYYGIIQVKAIVKNGKITDVQFLQYPNDRQNSIYVNSIADPMLKQEAIKIQSAKVNIITGATETSYAFIESLTNALNKAV